jgi:hypothetical protein
MVKLWQEIPTGYVILRQTSVSEWVTGYVPGNSFSGDLDTCEYVKARRFNSFSDAYANYCSRKRGQYY